MLGPEPKSYPRPRIDVPCTRGEKFYGYWFLDFPPKSMSDDAKMRDCLRIFLSRHIYSLWVTTADSNFGNQNYFVFSNEDVKCSCCVKDHFENLQVGSRSPRPQRLKTKASAALYMDCFWNAKWPLSKCTPKLFDRQVIPAPKALTGSG